MPIICVDEDGVEFGFYSSGLSHRAPVLAADGRPLREGETVWVTNDGPSDAPLEKGDEVTVRFVPQAEIVHVEDEKGSVWFVGPNDLTHERPEADSYQQLYMDMAGRGKGNGIGFFEFERRAKALAERGQ